MIMKIFLSFENYMYYLLKVKWWIQDLFSLLYNMNQLRLYKKHLKMRIEKIILEEEKNGK